MVPNAPSTNPEPLSFAAAERCFIESVCCYVMRKSQVCSMPRICTEVQVMRAEFVHMCCSIYPCLAAEEAAQAVPYEFISQHVHGIKGGKTMAKNKRTFQALFVLSGSERFINASSRFWHGEKRLEGEKRIRYIRSLKRVHVQCEYPRSAGSHRPLVLLTQNGNVPRYSNGVHPTATRERGHTHPEIVVSVEERRNGEFHRSMKRRRRRDGSGK